MYTFVQGTYLIVQAASKLMVDKKTSNGSIINISSIEAKVLHDSMD